MAHAISLELGGQSKGFGLAGSSAFNPNSIAGLNLWFDASDNSTITIATGVNIWGDKSTNTEDLTAATASEEPALISAGQNGLDIIRFDGVNDTMTTGVTFSFGALTQPNTVFITMKPDTDLTAINSFYDGRTGRHAFWQAATTGNYNIYAGSTLASTKQRATTWILATNLYDGASSTMRENKTQYHTGNANTGSLDGFRVGANNSGALDSNIDIGEILVYNGSLSVADRDSIEDYLFTKWGI